MAKKTTSQGAEHDLLRIAAFMLFDAMLFHLVLANGRPEVSGFSDRGKDRWRTFLRTEWQNIRANINYKPVFNLAIDILDALPASPDTEAILEGLAKAAEDAVASGILLKHDFLGRIYHKLLLSTTGHYYATYYTSLPAAWMLAGLTLRRPNEHWALKSLDEIAEFSVLDPACGSGTLLSAAYGAIKDIYITSAVGELDLDTLHELLLGDVIHGWDVLDFAAHLSLTTLALHSDRVTSDHSNILRMPLGATGSRVQLGSLDRLQKAVDLKGVALTEPVEELDFEASREIDIPNRRYDVVMMNPPFSRSAKPNKTFGYSEDFQRKRMQAALAALGKDLGLKKAGVAGLTPFFMILGLEVINPGGRVGMVVPRSILSGVGSRDVRKRYEAEANIQFVVSNFDPGSRAEKVDGWSWSENTDLGEVLIVAQKNVGKPSAKARVFYVNVFHRPRTEVESLIVSQQILKAISKSKCDLRSGNSVSIESANTLYASVYSVDQSLLKGNWLTPCTFAAPELNQVLIEIAASPSFKLLTDILKIINREFATGRDIAPIKQNFDRYPGKTDARMVFGHQAEMNTIQLDKTHVKNAKGKKNPASKLMYKNFGSTILLAERPHMMTEALLAMRAPEKVLATAFWELQFENKDDENWFLLWVNSSYGIMTYLSVSTSSQADIFKLKKDQITQFRIPVRPKGIDARVNDLFDKVGSAVFEPYAEEFSLAAIGKGARAKVDKFFAKELGLPELTRQHYEALAEDPVISRSKIGWDEGG